MKHVERRPGALPGWVRLLVVLACVLTLAWFGITARDGARQLAGWARPTVWLSLGPALVLALIALAGIGARNRAPRFVRLVVVLPLFHVAVIAFAHELWKLSLPTGAQAPYPIVLVASVLAAAMALGGLLVGRVRDGAHAFAVIALANLMLLGLWLPIAGAQGAGLSLPFVLAPPLVVAIAFGAVVVRRTKRLSYSTEIIVGSMLVLAAVSCAAAVNLAPGRATVHANLIYVLAAAALATVVALVTLGAVIWASARAAQRALAHAPGQQVGIIAEDGPEAIALLEMTSWMRGPQLVQRPFSMTTPTGTVSIAGGQIVAPIPTSTTHLALGESTALILPGDNVVAGGIGGAPAGDPFRASAAPIATDGVIIGPAGAPRFGFADVALLLWRPCVVYLMVLFAVAAPSALASVFAEEPPVKPADPVPSAASAGNETTKACSHFDPMDPRPLEQQCREPRPVPPRVPQWVPTTVDENRITRSDIMDSMAKVKPGILACGARFPKASGQVKVTVRVAPDGSIAGIRVKNTPDEGLGACVAEGMKQMTFRTTRDGGSFSYPFVF